MPHPATLAILGTNTGVGKTHVGARCVRALSAEPHHLRVAAFKPLESGVRPDEPGDAGMLREAAGARHPLELVRPWALPRPVTPAEELERTGTRCGVRTLRAARDRIAADSDLVWFETAGGVLSPLLPHYTCADVAGHLASAALLIASDELGTISLTLSAIEALQRRDVPLLGVLLNRLPAERQSRAGEATAAELRNLRWIQQFQPAVRIFTDPLDDELLAMIVRLATADR